MPAVDVVNPDILNSTVPLVLITTYDPFVAALFVPSLTISLYEERSVIFSQNSIVKSSVDLITKSLLPAPTVASPVMFKKSPLPSK